MYTRIRSRKGFTLIELLVVVLIIGILAAIAVPQYFRVAEKGRASEAISWVQALRGAEERAMAKTGNYVTSSALDVAPPTMVHYTASAITPATSMSWAVILTRAVAAPTYGQYTVTYNSTAAVKFTCSNATGQIDLMP